VGRQHNSEESVVSHSDEWVRENLADALDGWQSAVFMLEIWIESAQIKEK